MLGSFFPRPALFFLSAIIWTALLVVFWYGYGTQLGQIFGFDIIEDREAVIGLGFSWVSLRLCGILGAFLVSPGPTWASLERSWEPLEPS